MADPDERRSNFASLMEIGSALTAMDLVFEVRTTKSCAPLYLTKPKVFLAFERFCGTKMSTTSQNRLKMIHILLDVQSSRKLVKKRLVEIF